MQKALNCYIFLFLKEAALLDQETAHTTTEPNQTIKTEQYPVQHGSDYSLNSEVDALVKHNLPPIAEVNLLILRHQDWEWEQLSFYIAEKEYIRKQASMFSQVPLATNYTKPLHSLYKGFV